MNYTLLKDLELRRVSCMLLTVWSQATVHSHAYGRMQQSGLEYAKGAVLKAM